MGLKLRFLIPAAGLYPDLVRDYLLGEPQALAFFSGPPTPEAVRHRALSVEGVRRVAERGQVADSIARYLEDHDVGDRARFHIDELSRPGTTCVVTGQQAGFLTGALYTIYKAVTAIRLSEWVRSVAGPCVPIFWLASEDHDHSEVRGIQVPGEGGRPVDLSIPIDDHVRRRPASSLLMDERVRAELDRAREVFGPGRSSSLVSEWLRRYGENPRLAGAAAGLLLEIFRAEGLLVIEPTAVRHLARPVILQEIRRPAATSERLEAARTALRSAGYRAPIRSRRDIHVFVLREDRREAVGFVDGRFECRATGERWTSSELESMLEGEPEIFSPDVALRPVVQDAILPSVATVAGPGEIAYLAQLGGVYENFGVQMPVIVPRLSATIVGGKIARAMERTGVSAEGVLAARSIDDLVPADQNGGGDETIGLEPPLERLVEGIPPGDPLRRRIERVADRIRRDIDQIRRLVRRSRIERAGSLRDSLERILAHLKPGGKLQERVFAGLYYVHKHGPDLIRTLMEAGDPFDVRHRWIEAERETDSKGEGYPE